MSGYWVKQIRSICDRTSSIHLMGGLSFAAAESQVPRKKFTSKLNSRSFEIPRSGGLVI